MNPSPQSPADQDRICSECVGEPYLKVVVQRDGVSKECRYCGTQCLTISLVDLATHVERAFLDHFERTASEPDGFEWAMQSDPESDYVWEREGDPAMWAIASAADVDKEIAEDLRLILEDRHHDHDRASVGEECPFVPESHYAAKAPGNGTFPLLWNRFANSLKFESRFFSAVGLHILNQIFFEIENLHTNDGTPVVIEAGPTRAIKTLYRARVFAGEDKKLEKALEVPWDELGTPPPHFAKAGRMNASGVAVFYGALDADTAVAEVRPPVGSKVAVAQFHLSRDLRLLDVSALQTIKAVGSIFDPETIKKMEKANFFKILSREISRAIMPQEETSEYLPTQAVADYLANEAGLDGMVFPSVQAGQKSSNVVLFHKSSRVGEVDYPPGTTIGADIMMSTGDGDFPDYKRWIRIPEVPPIEKNARYPDPFDFDLPDESVPDRRKISLRIDLVTIEVLHIESVKFGRESHSVKTIESIDRNYDHLDFGH